MKWRPVVGFEDLYEVSDLGCVRSLRSGRLLRPAVQHRGHLRVVLCRDGDRRHRLVHDLVLEAWSGPCPAGMQGCHRDGRPANNELSNLRWDTASENARDAVRHGTQNMTRKTRCKNDHKFTPENTYIRPSNGQRVCRQCNRDAQARRARRTGRRPVGTR